MNLKSEYQYDLMFEFDELFENIFEENMDIDDAIESFLMLCDEHDVDVIIKKANDSLSD